MVVTQTSYVIITNTYCVEQYSDDLLTTFVTHCKIVSDQFGPISYKK